jgi:hypothetical protein
MSRINNTIKTSGNTTIILVTKNDDLNYLKEVVIDTSDLHLIKKVHVKAIGYPWTAKCNLAHLILGHTSNMATVVDHINGNKLDNRKVNLRVLKQCDNANNRNTSSNNTGVVGIARRKNGNYEYFRVTVSDRSQPINSSYTKSACKKYTKQFNITKLGEDAAFKQAKEWLAVKRKEFDYIES